LTGTEVKALRAGKANLKDSYAVVKDDEVFLKEMHISPYDTATVLKSRARCGHANCSCITGD